MFSGGKDRRCIRGSIGTAGLWTLDDQRYRYILGDECLLKTNKKEEREREREFKKRGKSQRGALRHGGVAERETEEKQNSLIARISLKYSLYRQSNFHSSKSFIRFLKQTLQLLYIPCINLFFYSLQPERDNIISSSSLSIDRFFLWKD